MTLTSTAFENNSEIPTKYTCEGEGTNPPLQWTEIPEGTISLALITEDPDTPSGQIFTHWIMWNIPSDNRGIVENSQPNAKVGKNSAGGNEYYPPCPPDKEHRYFFKLYALNTTLMLDPETATRDEFYAALDGKIIAQAELVGRYNKL